MRICNIPEGKCPFVNLEELREKIGGIKILPNTKSFTCEPINKNFRRKNSSKMQKQKIIK